jgi:multisubunit Na+/H+ antiporter MnhC subunit
MYGRYSENIAANNVAARMVAFGTFVVDAHNMFGHNVGLSIWQPEVDKFLAEIGMPVQISLPQYELPKPTANK